MKRRNFSLAAVTTALSGGLPALATAQVLKPQPGADYLALDKRVPVEAPAGKIEVVEFFWYDCPHCNAFEPTLVAWMARLPNDVSVRRVPVGFRDGMVPQQRLYYALEALGVRERLHGKVFDAIHADKQLPKGAVGTEIARWIATQGVDPDKFLATYNALEVGSRVARATQLQDQYGVQGVPALGVAGRFYTDGELARTMPRALQIVDYLVAEVRAGRA